MSDIRLKLDGRTFALSPGELRRIVNMVDELTAANVALARDALRNGEESG